MEFQNNEFGHYIDDFLIDAKTHSENFILKKKRDIRENAAARGNSEGPGGTVPHLIDAYEKGFGMYANLVVHYIEKDTRNNPNIYLDVDFDLIKRMAKNKFSSIYLESRDFFKILSKRKRNWPNYADTMINPANDCVAKIERKLKQIERRLLLLKKSNNLSIKEMDIIRKVKEIITDWNLIPQKDKGILNSQIDIFINSKFTGNELIAIYRASIPSLEHMLCYIAEKCGIERKINDLGEAINAFEKFGYLTDETINILRIIHEPFRDILEHGKKEPSTILKLLCFSLFESIYFIRDSIKKKKGM